MTSIPIRDVREYDWNRPLSFLADQIDRLPRGRALDLAMGEGRNAVYLAQQGYQVDGVDLSEPSVLKAMELARSRSVQLRGIVADLATFQVQPGFYDLICCFFFLERSLFPSMIRGLRPGGVILYQSVTIEELEINPSFPIKWCLKPNELLQAFRPLRILYYRETGPVEKSSHSALASLVAERPAD